MQLWRIGALRCIISPFIEIPRGSHVTFIAGKSGSNGIQNTLSMLPYRILSIKIQINTPHAHNITEYYLKY